MSGKLITYKTDRFIIKDGRLLLSTDGTDLFLDGNLGDLNLNIPSGQEYNFQINSATEVTISADNHRLNGLIGLADINIYSDGVPFMWVDVGIKNFMFGDVGPDSGSGLFHIKGREDERQLIIQGFSTQTSDILCILNDAGSDLFCIDNSGNVSITGQFISTLATGTAPFTVASTTKVTNLNADLLDGLHVGISGSAIPALDASNTFSGQNLFSEDTFLATGKKLRFGDAASFVGTGTAFLVENEVGSSMMAWNTDGPVVFGNSINLPDNEEVQFGDFAGGDVTIDFDGSDLVFEGRTGNPIIKIKTIPLRVQEVNGGFYNQIGQTPTIFTLTDLTGLYAGRVNNATTGAALGFIAYAELGVSHTQSSTAIAGLNAIAGIAVGNTTNYTNSGVGLTAGGYLFLNSGTGTIAKVNGLYFRFQNVVGATVTEINGFNALGASLGAGTVTTYNHFRSNDVTMLSGTFINQIGYHVNVLSGAVNNYAIAIDGLSDTAGDNDIAGIIFNFNNQQTEYIDSATTGHLDLHAAISIDMNTDMNISTKNIITDITTGTKIGTATGQKIGFWNTTPVVQQADIVALTDNSGGTANDTIQALTDPVDTPATADALRDDLVANLIPELRNNLADLTAKYNALRDLHRTIGTMA